jgi:hypothetical protein
MAYDRVSSATMCTVAPHTEFVGCPHQMSSACCPCSAVLQHTNFESHWRIVSTSRLVCHGAEAVNLHFNHAM